MKILDKNGVGGDLLCHAGNRRGVRVKKATLILLGVLVTGLGLVASRIAHASQAKPDEEGFVSIFNGKDLTGWAGDTDGYRAVDGVLEAESERKPVHGARILRLHPAV